MSSNDTERTIGRLLAAIESRDLRAVEGALAPSATWQNVPHAEVSGRDAVLEMLAGIITWSDRVRWDVISASYDGGTGWVERVDRFWIDGVEHAVRCNGVVRVDRDTDTVVEVRDYVDLGEWRARIRPVYKAMATRSPIAVVERHVDAVDRRDTVAMAADYALDAELRRGGECHQGWRAIADYFDTVPRRLGTSSLSFGAAATDGRLVTMPWTIRSGDAVVASGTDEFEVDAGRIARQVVRLDSPDF